jgi:hypothetical protein
VVVNIGLKASIASLSYWDDRSQGTLTYSELQWLKPLTLNLEKRREKNACSTCSAHVGYKKHVHARRKKLGNFEKSDGIVERQEIGDLENGGSEIRRSTCASQ